MRIPKTLKSKTIDINLLSGAVAIILPSLGVEIGSEVVTAYFTILNIILRFFTNGSISDK